MRRLKLYREYIMKMILRRILKEHGLRRRGEGVLYRRMVWIMDGKSLLGILLSD
jgi:hypothetical protein